jgi:hypothetical protein
VAEEFVPAAAAHIPPDKGTFGTPQKPGEVSGEDEVTRGVRQATTGAKRRRWVRHRQTYPALAGKMM